MARKSRWQQFTDNFNSVYGTFTDLAQNIETKRVMDDEKFTSEGGLGSGLEGSALEKARYKALGDIYTKYGNAEQGLQMRSQLADLEAKDRENTINQSIMQELIAQRGALQSGLMRGQTNAANASANSSNASAANSYSLIGDRAATQPYRLESLGLANDGARIGNANSQLAYDLGTATFNSDVETARANADLARSNADVGAGTVDSRINQSVANAALTGAQSANSQLAYNLGTATFNSDVETARANAGLASSNAAVGASTVDSRIDQSAANAALTGAQADNAEINAENAAASQEGDQAVAASNNALTIAQNALNINTAEAALQNATTEDMILSRVMSANYETGAEADAAAIADIQRSDIPFERKAALISTIQKMGLETLANEGATFTQQGLNALGKGLDAGIEWYDGVDDGNTLAIERGEDGTVRVMETRGDAVRELFSATGDTAEQQILAQLATQIQQPSNALAVAASVADIKQSQAVTANTESRTNLIDKQAFTELLTQDATRARTALVEAQTAQTLQEVEAGKNGLGKSQEIAQRGLAQLQASEAFAILGEAEGGRVLQLDAIGDYMRVMRMPGAPPAGVEGSVWMSLSEEDKAAFQ